MRPPEFACTGYTARVQYQSKEISEIVSSIITAHLLKFVFARMTKGPSKFRQAQHLSNRWEAQSGVPTRLSSKPLVGNSSNMASSRFGGAIAWACAVVPHCFRTPSVSNRAYDRRKGLGCGNEATLIIYAILSCPAQLLAPTDPELPLLKVR